MPSYKLIIQDEVNIRFDGLPVEIRRKLSNSLKFEVPYARHTPQYKLGRWDGTKGYFGIGGSGYLNHLEVLLPILEQSGYTISEMIDNRTPFNIKFDPITEDFWGDTCWPVGHQMAGEPIRLRDYQVNVINTYLKNPQSLQEIATGAGKTIITATLSKIAESAGRTIVIVPNKHLVVQTEADYINCGLDVGVYFGDRKDLNKTHTICTWQSLNILDKKAVNGIDTLTLAGFLEGVSTIIVDEVHMAKAEVLTKLLTVNLRNAPIRWGLTGTIPKEKFEFQGILASLGPVVGNMAAHQLQEQGVLADCHVEVLQFEDHSEFRNYQEELKYLVTNEDRLAFMANKIKEITETGNTLILVDRIKTGEIIQSFIPDSSFVKGSVKLKDRQDQYEEVKTATNKIIIATYGVAAVGIDIPRIFNLIMIEPGKSFVRVIQSIGRGVRKAKDKDFVQIWDITSTCKFSKRHLRDRKKYYKEAHYPYSVKKIDWK